MQVFWFNDRECGWHQGQLIAGRPQLGDFMVAAVYTGRGLIVRPQDCGVLRVVMTDWSKDEIEVLQAAQKSGYKCLLLCQPPKIAGKQEGPGL